MLDKPLDEFNTESGEPVPVGNHKSELISAVKSLQYGYKSLALPIESSGDVSDNLGSGEEFPHLASDWCAQVEVSACCLAELTRQYPADDCLGVCLSLEEGVDVVEALASGVPVEFDFALAGIAPQGLRMESEPRCGPAAGQIGHAFILT